MPHEKPDIFNLRFTDKKLNPGKNRNEHYPFVHTLQNHRGNVAVKHFQFLFQLILNESIGNPIHSSLRSCEDKLEQQKIGISRQTHTQNLNIELLAVHQFI